MPSARSALSFFVPVLMAVGCASPPAACPSIQSYCLTNACVENWSSAQQPATWCTGDGGAPYYWGLADVYIHPGCGGFNVVVLSATDVGTFYLYDVDTGLLVGVGSSGSWSCVAGRLPASQFSFACGADGGLPPSACRPSS
jgi:hypothetical protein